MTEIQERAMELLSDGPKTCTELGELLWADKRTNVGPRQSWARPAGKLMRALKKLGKVDQTYHNDRIKWRRIG